MLTQTSIILGFTGPIGSGCSYLANAIAEKYRHKYYKLSDIIRDRLPKELHSDVQTLQDKGNELRKEHGDAFLVSETLGKIASEDPESNSFRCSILDGIKHVQEVQALRMAPNFFLFSVQADTTTRKNRLVPERFKNKQEFEAADIRDQLEDDPNGQQVKKCDYLSDVIILNEKDIPKHAIRDKDDFINRIYWQYIEPIEKYADSRAGRIISPSIDELCMTIAFSMSKMSSCLKRKVGAVIVQENTITNGTRSREQNHITMPNIVSSGYNDVPLGQPKCLYHPKFQKCYRDYLQEEHSSKLKCCPNCGKEIIGKLSKAYECSKCGTEVFKEFVPGAKYAPGKLLDMCRALHAEETALLNLIRNNVAVDNLVLYTTTQPCNLCANKIVNSGIKKVVFSDPYTMKESEEILTNGKVEVSRFQGIKSNAFFRLYQGLKED
jgi:deoxycytidylate deaminase